MTLILLVLEDAPVGKAAKPFHSLAALQKLAHHGSAEEEGNRLAK
jgi:hypothetical protein